MMSQQQTDGPQRQKKTDRTRRIVLTGTAVLVLFSLLVVSHINTSEPAGATIQQPINISHENNDDIVELNPAASHHGDPTQNAIGHVVNILHEDFSSYFSYAYWRSDGVFEVGFAYEAPVQMVEMISAMNIPYIIVEGVGATAAQISLNTSLIADALAELLPTGSTIIVAANTPAGRYEVTTSDMATVVGRREVSQYIEVDLHNFELYFNHTQDQVHAAGYGRAGGTWLMNQYGGLECTSSFVVHHPQTQELGILTAGHCRRPLRFVHQVTGAQVTLVTRTRVLDQRGDIMFLASPVMFDAWFHYRPFTGRPQEGIQTPFHGQTVCHFGMASNAMRCGTVEFPSTSVRMETRYGPVTVGN